MKIEKEKRKVVIMSHAGVLISGFVHINPGERIMDFINDQRESFIAVTDAQFYTAKEKLFFKTGLKLEKKKEDVIILNKQEIWYIKET